MHRTERDILLVFRDEPTVQLGTAQILSKVFSEQAKHASSLISDAQTRDEGLRLKAMLHRRLLYHLNRLEADNVLRISDIKGRGEKVYALATPGSMVLGTRANVQPHVQTVPLIDLEHDSIFPFAKSSISSRVNCFAFDCTQFLGIHRCDAFVRESIARVNDCVALVGFEHLIRSSSRESMEEVLAHWDIDSKDYDKRICLIIRLSELSDDANSRYFISCFARLSPKAMRVVFEISPQLALEMQPFLAFVVKQFSESRTKMNLVNNTLGRSFAVGKAGSYSIPRFYGQQSVVVASASVIIDVEKALTRSKNPADFRRLVRIAAKHLLDVAKAQRSSISLESSGVYGIRLWNYNWEHDIDMIGSCREDIARFSKDAEIIALSAGMPVMFRIAFGSLTKPEIPELSKRAYRKAMIKSVDDFSKSDVKEYLASREKSFAIFDLGDRARFFREPFARPEDVVREFGILLTSYRIPLFTYDFSDVSSRKTLEEFF